MTPMVLALLTSIVVLGLGAQLLWNAEAIGLAAVRVAVLLLPAEMAAEAQEEWSRHVLDLAAEGHRLAPALWGLRSLLAAIRIAVPTTRQQYGRRFPGRQGAAESVVLGFCLLAGTVVVSVGVLFCLRSLASWGPTRTWPLLLPLGLVAGLALLASNGWRSVFASRGWTGRPVGGTSRLRIDLTDPIDLGPSSEKALAPAADDTSEAATFRLHLPSGRAEMVRRGPIDLLFLNSSGRAVDVWIGTDQGVAVAVTEKLRVFETEIGAVHVTNLGDAAIHVAVTPVDERSGEPQLSEPATPQLAGS